MKFGPRNARTGRSAESEASRSLGRCQRHHGFVAWIVRITLTLVCVGAGPGFLVATPSLRAQTAEPGVDALPPSSPLPNLDPPSVPGNSPSMSGGPASSSADLRRADPVLSRTAVEPEMMSGTITAIVVSGNSSVREEMILAKISSRVGRPLDQRTVDADIKALYATSWFSHVTASVDQAPTGAGKLLTFVVQEMPVLTAVEFRGLKSIKLKEVEESTGLKVGARADAVRAQLAVQQLTRLYQEKGFELVEIKLLQGGKIGDTKIVLNILEGPRFQITAVKFEGNSFATDAMLNTKIASGRKYLGLLPGEFHQDLIDEDARKLRGYYQGQGFFEVRVTPVVRSGTTYGQRVLTFVVHEGSQYKVRNILFEGNEQIATAKLKEGMSLHSGQPFSDVLRESDRKALTAKYYDLGCIFTQIEAEPRYVDPAHGVIDLVYKIKESTPYMLGDLIVKGNVTTKDKVIRREAIMAGLLPGELLNTNRIDAYRSRLAGTGYFAALPDQAKQPIDIQVTNQRASDKPYGDDVLRASYSPGISRMQSADSDPLPVPPSVPGPSSAPPTSMEPGGMIPFGSGGMFNPPQDTLPPIVVPPPPDLPPPPAMGGMGGGRPGGGGPNDRPRVPNSEGTPAGIFPSLPPDTTNEVGPDRSEPFKNRSYADIVTQVEEGPTGRLMFGVGATSYGGLSGNLILHERNFDLFNVPRSWSDVTSGRAFRGAGQEFRLELSPGTLINRFMVSFREPYLFDMPVALGMSGYMFQRYYPDYNEDRAGGRFSLGKQLGTQTYVDLAMRMENVNFYGYRWPAPADYLAASGNSTLFGIRPSIRFDNRNDPMLPNKGQYLEMAFEQGFGTFTFPVFTAEARQYFTVWSRPDGSGKQILTMRGFLGVAGQDTPVYERFYAGDFRSMRGFAFRGVGPYVMGSNTGGIFSVLGSVEYQFPWTANDRLHQVVFCDFGTVESDYQLNDVRAAIGTGVRVTVPGLSPLPLAFDLAFPINKLADDRTRAFTFFIGAFW